MKKLLVLIGLFLIALIAGFLYAEWKGMFNENRSIAFTDQVNYLIIRVDDLKKNKPALQTIWGAFLNKSDGTALYFNPLYPTDTSGDLKSSFSLNEKRLPDQAFMQALKKYDFDIHGLVLIDNTSEQYFFQWMSPVISLKPSSSANLLEMLAQQRQSLKVVCQALKQRAFSPLIRPDWNSIQAGHFITTPSQEQYQSLFEILFYKARTIDCQVME